MLTNFAAKLGSPLTKNPITVLQINLGKKCNLACHHCHVEAGPKRAEELSPDICEQLLELIERFPQIKTVDLTGGAPEMHFGFKLLVEKARLLDKEVIVRSNLTIFLEPDFRDLPSYLAQQQVRIIASLPCYLENNVDQQRGNGVYHASIKALQILNQLGYGRQPNLILDLVYNPAVPRENNFRLTPNQNQLSQDYKNYLKQNFDIDFNQIFTITNLPIGRVKMFLENHDLYFPYLHFLEENYNPKTVDNLMCRNQLSVDYLGRIYDCDFNQMANLSALNFWGEPLTVKDILEQGSLEIIKEVQTDLYCYGCTAGCGSSCGGALVEE